MVQATSNASDPFVRARNHFRFIQWDITARCNLRCIHCRSESFYGSKDLERDMPLPAIKTRLEELAVRGIRRIHFLGGEPFCRSDLAEIVRHATGIGILCSINTNATLITEPRAREIIEAGAYLLTFSIDGPDAPTNDTIRGPGSFERIVRGIENVQRAKSALRGRTRLICSHVLMRPNYERVVDMVDLCTELGLQNLIVTGLRQMGGAIGNYPSLKLTRAENLEAAEALIARLQSGRPHCNVQIDIVGLLHRLYLNERFGLNQPVTRSGCNAVASKAYVQPDGTLFPCQDVAKAVGKRQARAEIQAEGVDTWNSSRYSSIALGLKTLEVYRNYVPCRSCPALGRLCLPCPLRGVRGEHAVQEECIDAYRRAKQDGIDLRAAIERSARGSATERIIEDPSYRLELFAAEQPEDFLRAGCEDEETRQRLSAFRDATLGEIQSLLRAGLEQVGGNADENPC